MKPTIDMRRPNVGIKIQQLQTHIASPAVRPRDGSGRGISNRANSFPNDAVTFSTTMNCQIKPKAGMRMSQTIPGFIVLETEPHFFSASCSVSA
jgi:hypothetical protein